MGLLIVNTYFIISSILLILFSILNSKGKVTDENLARAKAFSVIANIQFLAFLIINGVYWSLKFM